MFLPSSSSSMKLTHTEEDAKRCAVFVDQKELNFFSLGRSFEEGIQRHYENFRIERVSHYNAVLLLFCFVYFLNHLVISLSWYEGVWFIRIASILRLVMVLVGLFLHYKIFYDRVYADTSSREEFHSYVASVTAASNFCVIATALINGAVYTWMSSLGSCLHETTTLYTIGMEEYTSLDCNPFYELGMTHFESMMTLILGNIFMIAVLRSHSYWAARISYVITVICSIAAAAVSRVPFTSLPVLFAAAFALCVYKNMEFHSLSMFEALLDLEASNRVKTAELKQFIGNVAHDLKVY